MRSIVWIAAVALAVIGIGSGSAQVADPGGGTEAILPGYSKTRLHVKFNEGTRVRLRDGQLVSLAGADLSGLDAALATYPVEEIERLFTRPEAALDAERLQIEAETGEQLPDLNLYYRFVVADAADGASLVAALVALPVVEEAYAEPLPAPLPATPDLTAEQRYRAPAPGGIGADAVTAVPGAKGDSVKVIDIEYAWSQTHEDVGKARLAGALIPNGTPVDPFNNANHGTAVIGELVGDDNGLGVTGVVPNAQLGLVNVNNLERGWDLANAVSVATANLSAGDVMLIEQQVPGANGGCGVSQVGCAPVEWVPAIYDAIVTATSAGIVVVEAAGNGRENLDGAAYGAPFPAGRPDSGAIIVGAGGAPGCDQYVEPERSRLPYSSFGTRVDLHGWGECVTTTGYGDLFDGGSPDSRYSARFSGTSSASPIVAAAAAALSSAYETANPGKHLAPEDIRDVLQQTGSPQNLTDPGALTGRIGPFPNLEGALAFVQSTRTVRLTHRTADDFGPVWSPAGDRLVFYRSATGSGPSIVSVDVSGGNERELVASVGAAGYPAWSPNGQKIAFDKAGPGEHLL